MSRQLNMRSRSGPTTTLNHVEGGNEIDEIVDSVLGRSRNDIIVVDSRVSPVASPRMSPRFEAELVEEEVPFGWSTRGLEAELVEEEIRPRMSPRFEVVEEESTPWMRRRSPRLVPRDTVEEESPRTPPRTSPRNPPKRKSKKKSKARTANARSSWKRGDTIPATEDSEDDYLDMTVRQLLERLNLQPNVSVEKIIFELMKSDPIGSMFR